MGEHRIEALFHENIMSVFQKEQVVDFRGVLIAFCKEKRREFSDLSLTLCPLLQKDYKSVPGIICFKLLTTIAFRKKFYVLPVERVYVKFLARSLIYPLRMETCNVLRPDDTPRETTIIQWRIQGKSE